MADARRCPQCGGRLPGDAPAGLCPECLFELGMIDESEGRLKDNADGLSQTTPHVKRLDAPRKWEDALLIDGQQYGDYRIIRRLGRGGMGAVYEAENLENGRRVALKVLGHSLDSPETRRRFLREGRLAASINHPNSVYVYGTEEIEGTPTISMELVAGGTLEGRVRQTGPLPVTEAVDIALQIIAGLEAAQAVGVLHRDVKPGNCFVDSDGTVKVGDFGLSISTSLRGESNLTTEGTFLGTPAFAPPEQLRGDELDVRADIYAVGVTLYFLLTGRTPFGAQNLVQLLAKVLERPAPSPASVRSQIPRRLARVVLRCLEKQPANRYGSYDELRQAVVPFSSIAPTPATLGWRFAAGVIDTGVGTLALFLVGFVWFPDILQDISEMRFPDISVSEGLLPFLVVSSGVFATLYFALPEGIWGATLGKALCGLRVVGPNRKTAGISKTLIRGAVFTVFPQLGFVVYLAFVLAGAASNQVGYLTGAMGYSYYVFLALMFSTARRRNGFAGIHDFLSKTRVIVRSAYESRPVLPSGDEPLPDTAAMPRIGPYHVLVRLHETDREQFVLGYDRRLLRKVWIRTFSDGEPPVAEEIQTLGRRGRLRWLGGKRAPDACWDAYEALSGKSLVNLLGEHQPWHLVRHWLLDLAEELNAALKDGSLPTVLALDRVWISAEGRAMLLDFPAPGVDAKSPFSALSPITDRDFASVRLFLNQIAIAVLEGVAIESSEASRRAVAAPLPMHAKAVLNRLPASPGPTLPVGRLKPLLLEVATVSRLRRLMVLAGCLVLPTVLTAVFFAVLFGNERWLEEHPDILPLRTCLKRLETYEKEATLADVDREQERKALEVYIAGHFRMTISDPALLADACANGIMRDHQRRRAERILADHPISPTEQEVNAAADLLRPFLDKAPRQLADIMFVYMSLPVYGLCLWGGQLLLEVAIPSLICALLFRGGLLLYGLRMAVVAADGSRASRLRTFWRSLIAWSPCLLLALPLAILAPVAVYPLLPVLIALVVWSVSMAERGLPDRIAHTYLVPR